MDERVLYIFVEGNDDERFFRKILLPYIDKRVHIIKYAQMKKKLVIKYLSTILESDDDYLIVADIDEIPSITKKVHFIKDKFETLNDTKVFFLSSKKIVIVVLEIESWYIAGMSDKLADEHKIDRITNTETINKEMFNNFYHGKFHSRIDFMQELLNNFSYHTAVLKNKSFKYFVLNFTNNIM